MRDQTREQDAARLTLFRLAHALGLTLRRQGPLYFVDTGAMTFGPAKPGALLNLLQDLYALPEPRATTTTGQRSLSTDSFPMLITSCNISNISLISNSNR